MAYKKFTASEDQLKPDPRFNSKLVSKFINCLMWDGKKAVAQKIFYDAMDQATKKVKDVPPLELFETAINNIKPYVEVRSRRVGGANYQVPMQVNKRRQQSLAFRWLINACRAAGGPACERQQHRLPEDARRQAHRATEPAAGRCRNGEDQPEEQAQSAAFEHALHDRKLRDVLPRPAHHRLEVGGAHPAVNRVRRKPEHRARPHAKAHQGRRCSPANLVRRSSCHGACYPPPTNVTISTSSPCFNGVS